MLSIGDILYLCLYTAGNVIISIILIWDISSVPCVTPLLTRVRCMHLYEPWLMWSISKDICHRI